jgi:hypothetical protein
MKILQNPSHRNKPKKGNIMSNQNPNRVLRAMTAEAYFKHKEVIEAWLQGAEVEFLINNAEWICVEKPVFHAVKKYRIKPANIKKYIVVGFDGDENHHTCGVWSHKVETCIADEEKVMRPYNQQRTLIELEINPSNGKVVAAKVVE